MNASPPQTRVELPLAVALVLSTGVLMEQLDVTIVTASIPTMAAEFGVSALRLKLAITAYVLSLGVLIPISGWVADRIGARRVFLAAVGVFTLGSILCGLANDLMSLVGARILQGAGGAMMSPVARLILLRIFPREKLVTAIAYMTTPLLIAPLIGPLIGGFFTTYLSWRWIFFINIPVGIIGTLAVLRFIPDLPPEPRRPFDFLGFVISTLAIILLLLGFENLDHPFLPVPLVVAAFGVGLALAVLYWRYALRREHPALDIRLFDIRAFRVAVIFGAVARLSLATIPFMLQLQFQIGFGWSAVHAGSLVFVTAFGALTLKPVLSRLLRRFGFRNLLIYNSIIASAMVASFSLFTAETPAWIIIPVLILFGFVRSTQFSSTGTLTFADIPQNRQSASVSLAGVALQLSIALGVSLTATIIGLMAGGGGATPNAEAMSSVFLVMAASPLLALIGYATLTPEDGATSSGHLARIRPETPPPPMM